MTPSNLKIIKLEFSEDQEEQEEVTLQKQLQEEKYLEENQEKFQDDQPLLSSKSFSFSSYYLFSPFNLVVVPIDEVYNSSSLQEEMESTHQAKNEKTEDDF